jgi:tetratricopeptide (TPR) repeat protein
LSGQDAHLTVADPSILPIVEINTESRSMKMAFSPITFPSLNSPIPEIKSGLLKIGAVLAGILLCLGLLVAPIRVPSLPSLPRWNLIDAQGLPATYHRAMHLRQQGDLVQALNYLQQAAVSAPQSVSVLYELGRAEFQLSQVENAIAHYQQALAANPDHAASSYELGSILVTLGQLDQGIQLLQHSIEIAPTPLTYYDLGIALGRKGDRSGKIEQLQQAIALRPDYADAHLNLGITYARSGDNAAARTHLQQARDLYQAEIEQLEHAHLGRNSLDSQIIDQMINRLDSGCGIQCWQTN